MTISIDTNLRNLPTSTRAMQAGALVKRTISDKDMAKIASGLNQALGLKGPKGRIKRVWTTKSLRAEITKRVTSGEPMRTVYNDVLAQAKLLD